MPNADTGNGFQLITALHQSTVTYSVVVLELMLKLNRYVARHGYALDFIIFFDNSRLLDLFLEADILDITSWLKRKRE